MPNAKVIKEPSLADDLLALYDDFAELDACYAFFCDAVAALCDKREECLENTSAEGLRVYSQWLKDKSAAFKGDLNTAWRMASSHKRH